MCLSQMGNKEERDKKLTLAFGLTLDGILVISLILGWVVSRIVAVAS